MFDGTIEFIRAQIELLSSSQGNYVTAGEMASGSTKLCRCSEIYVISNYVIKVNLLYKSMLVGGEL